MYAWDYLFIKIAHEISELTKEWQTTDLIANKAANQPKDSNFDIVSCSSANSFHITETQ